LGIFYLSKDQLVLSSSQRGFSTSEISPNLKNHQREISPSTLDYLP
jgi:hypothetical protein